MKSASLSEIKKELQETAAKDLVQLCLRVAKYKKENKEFIGYLLFEAGNRDFFIRQIREELDAEFLLLRDQTNLYYLKKGFRRILRILNRYCKYMDDKGVTASMLIYFCESVNASGTRWQKNKLIKNMYMLQLRKIQSLVDDLHEDLQVDFRMDIERLGQI